MASHTQVRRGIYLLLIALAVGNLTGRILAVNSVDTVRLEKYLNDEEKKKPEEQRKVRSLQRPFLSGNDRSRWCTVRALVEHGTYAIDQVVQEPNWDTIDMVKHDGRGNPAPLPDEGHLYSSKPPLLATLAAAEYWVLHKLTGKTLGSHPYELGRFMLITFNVIPYAIYLLRLSRIVERYGSTDWGRIFVIASASLATFFTTFATVFNNHWPAAFGALFALDATLRIVCEGERRWHWFFIAGLSAAFAAACELPALSLTGLVGALLLWRFPRATLQGFLPGVLLVAAASLGTNYAAHGTLRPAYSQRHEAKAGWYIYQYRRGERVIDSYWTDRGKQSPIDQGEPSRVAYALHVLVGHHGIFSLSPIWLLSAAGLVMTLRRREHETWHVVALITTASLVCLTFYLLRPLADRNYGGMTSGFRWAFWFAPLWLFAMLPAVDTLGLSRRGQLIGAVLLGLSVLSVSYPIWNPWTQPWLLNWWLEQGWIGLGTR